MTSKKIRLPDPGITWAFSKSISQDRNLCIQCIMACRGNCPKLKLLSKDRYSLTAIRCLFFVPRKRPTQYNPIEDAE